MQQLAIPDGAAVADAIVSTMLGAVSLSRLALTEASALAILANAEITVKLLLRSPAPTSLSA